jgi:thymidylate synthase (FAD)
MTRVTFVASMGSDALVVDAARVSLGRRAEQFTAEQNASLVAFLARNGHFTPFTHPQATFHVQAPIYVARQCFKSRVGFSGRDDDLPDPPFTENEVSRRYVTEIPTAEKPNWRKRAPGKKQGSAGPYEPEGLAVVDRVFNRAIGVASEAYEQMLKLGVAPEQARAVLPMATICEWYWTGSLAAWARFYCLRTATDAQDETGEVALAVGETMIELFPVSWVALTTPTVSVE